MSAADVGRIRDGYAAFNRGDLDFVLDQLGDVESVTERPEMPGAATHVGKEAVAGALRQLHEEFDDYRMEEEEMIDLEGQIVAVMRQSGVGRLSGVPVEGPIVHLWEVRDGRAVGVQAFSTREEALDAARAGPAGPRTAPEEAR